MRYSSNPSLRFSHKYLMHFLKVCWSAERDLNGNKTRTYCIINDTYRSDTLVSDKCNIYARSYDPRYIHIISMCMRVRVYMHTYAWIGVCMYYNA